MRTDNLFKTNLFSAILILVCAASVQAQTSDVGQSAKTDDAGVLAPSPGCAAVWLRTTEGDSRGGTGGRAEDRDWRIGSGSERGGAGGRNGKGVAVADFG